MVSELIWNSGRIRKRFLERETASSGTYIGDSSSSSLNLIFSCDP